MPSHKSPLIDFEAVFNAQMYLNAEKQFFQSFHWFVKPQHKGITRKNVSHNGRQNKYQNLIIPPTVAVLSMKDVYFPPPSLSTTRFQINIVNQVRRADKNVCLTMRAEQ